MSKIAEQKALEAYPELDGYIGNIPLKEAYNYARNGYSKGYNQAMQDFMGKVCEWLEDQVCYYSSMEYNGDTYEKEIVVDTDKMIEQFKNYMEDEQ